MLNDNFHYQQGQLFCEELPLKSIADDAGTPLYVYSAGQIRQNVARLQAAFPGARLHYSLKANANLAIIRLLHGLGLGMDAVSGGEVFRALQAGVAAEEIVFAGVGKTADELSYAVEAGVGWFNVENATELDLLNAIASKVGRSVQVALRLNPEVKAQTHRYIATGHGGAKFGMDADTIAGILARQADYPHLKMVGLHVHIGSQLANAQATQEAIWRAQVLATPYPTLRTLNIGGGFPVPYTERDEYPPIEIFAEDVQQGLAGWDIKLEPGRYIMANAGVLLVKVLYTKDQGGTHFAITDGSMAELLRPALYEAIHPIVPLTESPSKRSTVVVGPVCETADVLSYESALPADMAADDLLAVMMAGAYGFVMASNYNQRPRPAEVLVDGAEWRVIRRRESWQDLIALEG